MKTMTQHMAKWMVSTIMAGLMVLSAQARGGIDLWPVAEFSDERTQVLLYVNEPADNFMMVFPFYYRTNQGRDHHVVWPIFKTSEGRVTRFVPVWFRSDAGAFTLLPLMRQTPEYTAWSVPPIYMRHDGRFTGIFPVYAKSPNMMFIAPSFYTTNKYGTKNWAVWPLYFNSKSENSSRDMIPGLYFNRKTASGRTLWVAPYYYDKQDDRRNWSIAPLYFNSKSNTSSRDMIPGLYFNRKSESGRTLWVAPYWYDKNADKRSFAFVPLYFQSNSPDKESYTVPFLFNYDKEPAGYSLNSTLYFRIVKGDKLETGFFPAWYYSSKGTGENKSSNTWLFPMYRETKPGASETIVLPLYYNRAAESAAGKKKDLWLLPWVYGNSPTHAYSGLLPVYYASKTIKLDETQHNFNLLWPLFHREQTIANNGAELEYYRRFLVYSDSKDRQGGRKIGLMGLTYEWTPGQK